MVPAYYPSYSLSARYIRWRAYRPGKPDEKGREKIMKKSRHSGTGRLIAALCGLLAACGLLPDGKSPLPDPSPTGSASPAASPLASPAPSPSASPSAGPSIPPSPLPGAALIIDHSNFDPAGFSAAEIGAAAALDGYFQHASVGANVCEGIDSLAAEAGSRYVLGRPGTVGEADPAWFDAHNGLWDYQRGNPGVVTKIADFVASLHDSVLATKLDVATFKFCWIDTPLGDQNLTMNAQQTFDATRTAIEGLETEYPLIAFVWWTMPIERDAAQQTRQDYNDLVRAYCAANGEWLFDIADLESHDDAGAAKVDGSGRELQVNDYSSDGGHLNAAGERKMALAWWRLMAAIAASR
jgi:hypothetical protein